MKLSLLALTHTTRPYFIQRSKPLISLALRTMRLHEYQAASLLLKYRIPIPLVTISSTTNLLIGNSCIQREGGLLDSETFWTGVYAQVHSEGSDSGERPQLRRFQRDRLQRRHSPMQHSRGGARGGQANVRQNSCLP